MRIDEVRHPERQRNGKPLDGVRVLAAEQMQALPYATQLMAHLGAEVIKVEHPRRGDSGRGAQPQITGRDGKPVGATYLRNNLGKQSVGIDLSQPEGAELFKRLASHFDIVAENHRSGAMERFGLGYAAIAAIDPRIIYVSISGFGNQGDSPYAHWPAYAPIAEAMGGLYEPRRPPGKPPTVVPVGALGDNGTALFAIIGTLAALHQRERTGRGQHVDVAMFDSMMAMADMVPFMWSVGASPQHAGPDAVGVVGAFRASDGHFVLAVFREHQFERLARTVGCPEWLEDPRFATRAGWAEHREGVVRPAVEAWAADKTKLEAAEALCAQGVAAGPSNVAEDLVRDPHVKAHDMLLEVPRPDSDEPMLVVGNPIKLSEVAGGPIDSFPDLGEHTEAVLGELLGLGGDELGALRGRGVI